MKLKINGKELNADAGMSLTEFIGQKDLNPDRIVVEHNLNIAPKEKWNEVYLKDGDTLEIVSFVGGG